MSIYLVRHTAPAVGKGICYGQSDIDVLESFEIEAGIIRQFIPKEVFHIYSSPLKRCRKLAEWLFPESQVNQEPLLKEINCGEWEMQHWDEIPKHLIDPWMNDFVNVAIPGGESYVEMHQRVTSCFEKITSSHSTAVIVTHGGVIRSILAHITETPLKDSFGAFSIHYGCVMQLDRNEESFSWKALSNIPTPREQHKPMM